MLEGAFDTSLSAGIQTAAYGGDFSDALRGSFVTSVVALGLADAQHGIGDLGLDEGSLGHATLHGIAGCIAAEAQRASCAAGLAGGISQSIFAGSQSPVSSLSQEELLDRAQLIGAAAGWLFSEGEAANVSVAGTIARSGFQNNYLNHDDLAKMRERLSERRAQNSGACSDDDVLTIINEFAQISFGRDVILAQCMADPACDANVLHGETVFNDPDAMDELRALLDENPSLPGYASMIPFVNTQVVDAYESIFEEAVNWKSQNCAEANSSSCQSQYNEWAVERAENIMTTTEALAIMASGAGAIRLAIGRGLGARLFSTCARSRACSSVLSTAEVAGTSADLAGCYSGDTASCVAVLLPGVTNATNRIATQADVAGHFQQNRQFWTQDPIQFSGNKVFQRDDLIDPNHVSEWTVRGQTVRGTNIERMAAGRAPIGPDGNSVNLHHLTQQQNGAIAEVTQTLHSANHGILHMPNTVPSGINRAQFQAWSRNYWKQRATNWGE